MTRQQVEQYLVSRRNVAGTVLGLGGLGLFLAGLTTWPAWLPITAGLYAIGVLVVPSQPRLGVRFGPGEDEGVIRDGLETLLHQIRNKVADDIYAKVQGIRDGILATVSTDAAASGAERDLFLIRQTALDYLPAALNTYLALPRPYAERRAVVGGRTAHDILLEQLQLMDEKMAEVADDIARHDTDRLLAHGRFLQDKFSGSALDLDNVGAGVLRGPQDDAPADAGAEAAVDATVDPARRVEAAQDTEATRAERQRVH